MKKPTLKQLDAAEAKAKEVTKKAWEKHGKLLAEYIKDCKHPRTRTNYDDWSELYDYSCGICGKHLKTTR